MARKKAAQSASVTERDLLTGLYQPAVLEAKVNQALAGKPSGVLLVIDIDRFKLINDQYGHSLGDRLLEEAARILTVMFFKTDILGRIGEDEFAVFLPVAQDEEFVAMRAEQLRQRLKEITLSDQKTVRLTISVGGSLYQAGDDYQALLERALAYRDAHRVQNAESELVAANGGVEIDMSLIRQELAEQEMIPGAYCQGYETFKSIYRFVERRMRRAPSEAYIILLTMTDGRGSFPPLGLREDYMELLKDIIQQSLRAGDVFTKYSSCQFLTMVLDLSAENAEEIAVRIEKVFSRKVGVKSGSDLLHHCYPLKPAGEKE